MAKGHKLKVKFVKSTINRLDYHRKVLRGLGLRKLQDERILPDRPEIRGMIAKVSHLVKVEEVKSDKE